jgi:cell division protein FtsW (lipid II flippase)
MLLIVCLTLFFYAAALAVASGTRLHSKTLLISAEYFVPFTVWLVGTLVVQRNIRRKLPNRDPWIFPATAGLTGLGMLTIWRLSPDLGLKQSVWFLVGCGLFLIALNTTDLIKILKTYKYVWLLLGLILIGLTFVVGVNPTGSGQRLWLKIVDFYIQPSEPLKLLLIVYLAAFFADQIRPNISWLGSVFPTLVVVGFAGLLLIAQRDLGTASLFVSLYILMLTVTTHRRRLLWLIPALAILAGTIGYFVFDVIRTRVDIWLNPWLDTSGNAWQLAQAQIAIASGGLTGTGPGLGSPQFVPVAVSDFIFTTIAEELGLLGTSAVMLLLLFLVIRGINIALSSKTTFGRYLAFGISGYFALQSIFIIGGNLGLLPLTGVTLPFLSYGGSSLVTNILAVLLLLRISTETSPQELSEKSRSPYRWVTGIFSVVFLLISAWNGYLAFPNREDLLSRAENPRWAVYDRYSPRGEIYALSGEKLVEVRGNPGSYELWVNEPQLSNTLGYAHPAYGQSGLERSQYSLLRGYAGVPFEERWQHELLFNQPPAGLDIKLNINMALQNKADELLGDHKGAIVLANAQTGEIYAIASHPSFDANTLDETWDSLMQRTDAPLVNRATQGSYPLGTLASTFAYGSLLQSNNAFELRSSQDLFRLDSYCYRAMQNAGASLNAFQFGCETVSEELLNLADPTLLQADLEAYGLFSAPDLAIETSQPSSTLSIDQLNQNPLLVMDINVNPVQMAMVAATITNDGARPAPALVNSYLTPEGNWQALGPGKTVAVVFTPSLSAEIQANLRSSTQTIWYQIGHAWINQEEPLTWYIGGTTPEWSATPLAIAIAIEEDAPDIALTIGNTLLNFLSVSP